MTGLFFKCNSVFQIVMSQKCFTFLNDENELMLHKIQDMLVIQQIGNENNLINLIILITNLLDNVWIYHREKSYVNHFRELAG